MNTTTGARTAGVTAMKSFVTKDLKLSGLSNHRKEGIGLTSDSFVDTASNVSSTAVIGGQVRFVHCNSFYPKITKM